ncbi:hypothetical protein [Pseudohongiella sp. O18]|uniref:hypothetical protein n=1 Tax=Pseudohongiella sp. O18 TaxID=2904248 RepID=UPI001F1A4F61|nr:hypothetical protein [Pseudohongiella sp. O18]
MTNNAAAAAKDSVRASGCCSSQGVAAKNVTGTIITGDNQIAQLPIFRIFRVVMGTSNFFYKTLGENNTGQNVKLACHNVAIMTSKLCTIFLRCVHLSITE